MINKNYFSLAFNLGLFSSDPFINFSASLIVFFKRSQYKFIDLLASSLPGIGKSIPVGSEFVSNTATMGIPNFLASATASYSILVSIINIKSGVFFISEIPPRDLSSLSFSLPNFKISFFVNPKFSFDN